MPATPFDSPPADAPDGIAGACVVGADVVVDENGNVYARETVFGGTSEAFHTGGPPHFSTSEDAAAMAYAVYQAYMRGIAGDDATADDLVRSLRLRFGAR